MPDNEETETETVEETETETVDNAADEPDELELATARIAALEGELASALEDASAARAKVTELQSAMYVMQNREPETPVSTNDEETVSSIDELFG